MDYIASINQQIENFFVTNIPSVDPLTYKFLVPPYISEPEFLRLVSTGVFPTSKGLYPAIYYAILLSLLRYILHKCILKPLALKAMDLKYPLNHKYDLVIERKFPTALVRRDTKYIDKVVAEGKYSKSDLHIYFRNSRREAFVDKKVGKFVEAAWRFLFYLVFCIVGMRALIFPDIASWVADTSNYWRGWPYEHRIESQVYFYYVVELGAYIHQLLWTEVSRSDAAEMIIHHFVTILLLVCSYLLNFSRIGSAIVLIHDVADIFLESAKCFNYTGKVKGREWASTVTDIVFGCFAITFFLSRLVYYPRFVVYDVLFILPSYYNNDWAGYYWFGGLLCTLQALHIFWFYLIARMIYRLVTTGIDKDERSDDEDGPEDEDDEPKKK